MLLRPRTPTRPSVRLLLAVTATSLALGACGSTGAPSAKATIGPSSDQVVAGAQSASPSEGATSEQGFAAATAEEVARALRKAMRKVDSFRVAGPVTVDGYQHQLDAVVHRDGRCVGTMTYIGQYAEGVADLRQIGDHAWIRYERGLLEDLSGEEVDKDTADLWSHQELSDDVSACGGTDILRQVSEMSDDELSSFRLGRPSRVPAGEVVRIERRAPFGAREVMSVALERPHRLLRIETFGGSTDMGVSVDLTDFGVEVDVSPPPPDLVVDLPDDEGLVPA
ncbi:MAG: hypothetical protein CMH83_10620 [Nocardioides sp.]|nr:hypothetical protein [Nocardioides sp.]